MSPIAKIGEIVIPFEESVQVVSTCLPTVSLLFRGDPPPELVGLDGQQTDQPGSINSNENGDVTDECGRPVSSVEFPEETILFVRQI